MASITFTTTLSLTFPTHRRHTSRSFKIVSCVSLNPPNDAQTLLSPPQNDAFPTPAPLRVAFAAGGTGGHIYPAVAIADALRLARPDARVLFLGRPDSMESAAIAAAGYDFAPVPATRLARPLISPRNLAMPFGLIKSTLRSLSELREFRPHVVVGTGGFVSFPTCLASAFLDATKLVIQEQNSVPGLANWALSRLADAVYVAFNSTVDCFPDAGKCLVLGNPVRMAPKSGVSREAAMAKLFPKEAAAEKEKKKKVVLVLGGSLGANAVNIAMLNVYRQMLAENESLFLVWQTGVKAFDEMESLVKPHPRLHLAPLVFLLSLPNYIL